MYKTVYYFIIVLWGLLISGGVIVLAVNYVDSLVLHDALSFIIRVATILGIAVGWVAVLAMIKNKILGKIKFM